MNLPPASIEYQCLHPFITDLAVEAAVREAIALNVGGLCIPPYWVKKASRDTLPAGIQLITVVGYPYGYQRTEAKLAEMDLAFADGAQEVELTINFSALRSQRWNWIKAEIARFSKGSHDREKVLTVLADLTQLSQEEWQRLCKDAMDAGADFIKVAASHLPVSALLEKVRMVREFLHPSMGLKTVLSPENADSIPELLRAGTDKLCVTDLAKLAGQSGKS